MSDIAIEAVAATPVATPPANSFVPSAADIPVKEGIKGGMDTTALSADFLEKAVRVKMSNGMYRYFTYPEFLLAVKGQLDQVTEEVAKNTVNFKMPLGVYAFQHSAKKIVLSSYYPGGIRDIIFVDTARPRVYPNIIMTTSITSQDNWKTAVIEAVRYMCTPLPLSKMERTVCTGPNSSKEIFVLPFSNMYDDGRMCTGSNHLPTALKDGDLRAINMWFELIFNSPFNNDLGVRAAAEFRNDPPRWFELLAKIAKSDKPEFPYEKLAR